MPNINESAKRWEIDLAGRVGEAVLRRRKVLGLTAVQLAERTADLGYPVTRVAVSKIENNARAGKLDVAELLVLARALDVPPVLLLFPEFPGGLAEVLPDQQADSGAASGWVSGRSGWQVAPDNLGTALIEDVERRRELKGQLFHATLPGSLSDDVRESVAAELRAELTATEERIESAKSQLWEGK